MIDDCPSSPFSTCCVSFTSLLHGNLQQWGSVQFFGSTEGVLKVSLLHDSGPLVELSNVNTSRLCEHTILLI